jgi:fatty acid amide hydrolase
METIQAQPGPMARSVEDLEIALQVLAADGTNSNELHVVPASLRPSRDVAVSQLRIGYWEDNGFFRYAPAVRRAVREAVAHLAAAGADVKPLVPPKISEAMYLFTAVAGADGAADCRRLTRGSTINEPLRKLLMVGVVPNLLRGPIALGLAWWGQQSQGGLLRAARPRSADDYWRLTRRVRAFGEQFMTQFAEQCDCLILPPYALPAPLHGQALDLIPAASDCLFVNLLGLPSGVVPVTTVRPGEESDRPASSERTDQFARATETGSAGLPVGVQVVSGHWREDIVLAVMRAIQAAALPTLTNSVR